jgi:hypothetical protein
MTMRTQRSVPKRDSSGRISVDSHAASAQTFFSFPVPSARSQESFPVMGRIALSDTVKKQKARRALNAQYQEAVQRYQSEQEKPSKERLSLRGVAALYPGVSYSTLSKYVKPGHISMSAFFASKQKISPAKERVMVDEALAAADRGFPKTRDELTYEANAIRKAEMGDTFTPVGKHWVQGFLDRHQDELKMSWSRPLDSKRARALNPNIIRHWYEELVKKHVVEAGIRPEDIYGMDESGFQPSDQGRQRVIARRGTKNAYKQGGADRENVTVIVTICADGTVLKPSVIFKGQRMQQDWTQNNVAGCS